METNVFYRYLRLVKFDPSRMELVTQPRGGVCLRFEPTAGSNGLWFTYARCHKDDLFSKSVAKNIVDGRARHLKGAEVYHSWFTIPYSASTDVLVDSIIQVGLNARLHADPDPTDWYQRLELIELVADIADLKKNAIEEKRKLVVAMAAIQSQSITEQYKNAGR